MYELHFAGMPSRASPRAGCVRRLEGSEGSPPSRETARRSGCLERCLLCGCFGGRGASGRGRNRKKKREGGGKGKNRMKEQGVKAGLFCAQKPHGRCLAKQTATALLCAAPRSLATSIRCLAEHRSGAFLCQNVALHCVVHILRMLVNFRSTALHCDALSCYSTSDQAPEKISLAKNPTICSCEYRSCGYHVRWNSPWDHGTCEGCAEMGATWAFGGAPYGATKRGRGVLTWSGARM